MVLKGVLFLVKNCENKSVVACETISQNSEFETRTCLKSANFGIWKTIKRFGLKSHTTTSTTKFSTVVV